MVKEKWNYELNLPKATTSSVDFNSYPKLLLFIFKNKRLPLCCMSNASYSIIIPLLKNIKSNSLVEVNPLGAEAVTAVKLAVVLLTKEPTFVNDFLK